MRKLTVTPWWVVAAFLLPSLVGFIVFVALPILMGFALALTNYSGGPRFKFVGLDNFVSAFGNPDFLHSLWVTIVFTVSSVVIQLLLGLAFALLLNKPFRGRDAFRGLLFLPNVLSSIAVGLSFVLILNPNQGPLNQFLHSVGIDPPRWLGAESSALPSIIMVAVWQSFGYYMILFLAGLQSIDQSLYEAAGIDGAGPVRKFFAVTLPGLTPVIFFSATIAIINAFKVFDQVYVMTGGQSGGGPADATRVLVFDIYTNAFTNLRFGYAAAESVILLVVVLFVTVIQYRGQKKWVNYDIV
jgi:multiple sugar transport system permease protein